MERVRRGEKGREGRALGFGGVWRTREFLVGRGSINFERREGFWGRSTRWRVEKDRYGGRGEFEKGHTIFGGNL